MALSAKQRAKAYRSRQKVKGFADKHFHGLHEATVDQFLHAVKIDESKFKERFQEDRELLKDPEEIWKTSQDNQVKAEIQAEKEIRNDPERMASIEVEAKKKLHADGYFEGLAEYPELLHYEIEGLVRDSYSLDDVERHLDEAWDALTPEEAEVEVQKAIEFIDWLDPERVRPSSYPLIELIEAYKELLSMP